MAETIVHGWLEMVERATPKRDSTASGSNRSRNKYQNIDSD